jgi:hypothetical protein
MRSSARASPDSKRSTTTGVVLEGRARKRGSRLAQPRLYEGVAGAPHGGAIAISIERQAQFGAGNAIAAIDNHSQRLRQARLGARCGAQCGTFGPRSCVGQVEPDNNTPYVARLERTCVYISRVWWHCHESSHSPVAPGGAAPLELGRAYRMTTLTTMNHGIEP